MPHLSDNVLDSIFDREPRLIRDVAVDVLRFPRRVVREGSGASCCRGGEGMQRGWKANGCSVGRVKLYEGTVDGGEAYSGYPDLRIIGVRDLAIIVVNELFPCPVSFELVVGVNQLKATAAFIGDGEDSRKDRDNVSRAVKEKGCHLREG